MRSKSIKLILASVLLFGLKSFASPIIKPFECGFMVGEKPMCYTVEPVPHLIYDTYGQVYENQNFSVIDDGSHPEYCYYDDYNGIERCKYQTIKIQGHFASGFSDFIQFLSHPEHANGDGSVKLDCSLSEGYEVCAVTVLNFRLSGTNQIILPQLFMFSPEIQVIPDTCTDANASGILLSGDHGDENEC